MNPVIDHVIVGLLVLASALSVGYMLSPLRAKRWILSRLSPLIGVRIISKLLPGQCGCEDCPASPIHQQLRRTVKRGN